MEIGYVPAWIYTAFMILGNFLLPLKIQDFIYVYVAQLVKTNSLLESIRLCKVQNNPDV